MANIAQIVKYEGDNTTFIWKSPVEDFNTGTQLIVHESQEAIFFMNGQALDLFPAGRYTLETQNIPMVRKFFNRTTNDQTPFHCEVYFINKTEQMAIKWGLASRPQYTDPDYGVPLEIGASGELTLQVSDSRKLLVKLVGTESFLGQEKLLMNFRNAILQVKIKSYLAQLMRSGEFSIFDIDAHLETLSETLHERLSPNFAEYGLSLVHFYVTTTIKPEENSDYQQIKNALRQKLNVLSAKNRQELELIEQQTASHKKAIDVDVLSEAEARKRQREGYTYQQERAYDVAEKVGENEGVGNFSGAGIGLGMMGGVAGGMGAAVAGITTSALNPITGGSPNPQPGGFSGGFEAPPTIDLKPDESETPAPQPQDDMAAFKQKIEKLKLLKESGMLSDEEFDAEKKKLLGNL